MSPLPPDGTRAAEFVLQRLGGGSARLADLVDAGGGVLVFLKRECSTSELLAARLAPLAETLAREERPFLAVCQGTEEEARAFGEAHAPGLALAWDPAPYEASRAYDVSIVPTLLVIDGAGVVAERLQGFVKSEYLALGASIEQALSLGDIPPVLLRPEELPAAKPG